MVEDILQTKIALDALGITKKLEDLRKSSGVRGGGGSGTPNDATYLTLSSNSTLTNERVLTAGSGISLTDAGANSTLTVAGTGVLSIAKSGSTALTGAVTLTGGANVTLTQSGNDISIASVGGGAGSPGGLDTQVQFNDAGVFGGNANLTYNKTTNLLSLTGSLNLTSGSSTTKALILNAAVSQSTNIVEVRNSGSGRLIDIDKNGFIGIGSITHAPWAGNVLQPIESVNTALAFGLSTDLHVVSNWYYDGNFKYRTTNPAAGYLMYNGEHMFRIAPSGTIDSIFGWNEVLKINAAGNVLFATGAALVLSGGAASGAGCIQMGGTPSNSYDTNLIYLNSTASTFGFMIGSTPSFQSINGPYFGGRGNDYGNYANQRGNLFFSSGNASVSTDTENQLKFFSGEGGEHLGMYLHKSGRVGFGGGTTTTDPVAQIKITIDSGTVIGLFVRGASGQSVNLQEWQNSSGTPLTTVGSSGLIAKYNNTTTAGWGVPAIYGSGRATGQTAANASVATYTCGAADGSFTVSANVLVTTSSAEAFTVTVSYTDEGNTARVVTFNFSTIGGTIGTGINFANGAIPYEGIPFHIRVKASTAITIKTAAGGTYTGCTYNVDGLISQYS